MSLYSLVKDSLYDVMAGALYEYPSVQDQSRFSHQNDPTPEGTTLVANIMEMDQIGKTQKSTLLSTTGELQYITRFSILVTFSCEGKDSGDIIYSFYERLMNTDSSNEANKLANLSLIDKTPVRRIPIKTDTNKWREYFNFVARFHFTSSIKEDVYPVQSVTIEAITGASEETLNSITFTIPPS